MIKVFYDVETTGLKATKHSIHQIAGFVEINGNIVEKFDIKSRPHPKAEYSAAAMEKCRVTEQQLKTYQSMGEAYKQFVNMINSHIDKHDRKDKAFLVGYNNLNFDDIFLRVWFEQNGNPFLNSYFWAGSLDVMSLSSQYLLNRRADMPSFKLFRVAKTLGLEVDKSKIHDAYYDVCLTWQIYRIVTGLEIEL